MKKVAVIGHYAYSLEYLDGQTIKTKIPSAFSRIKMSKQNHPQDFNDDRNSSKTAFLTKNESTLKVPSNLHNF